MDIVHIEQLLYYRRFLFSVLELNARYDWRDRLQTRITVSFQYASRNGPVRTYTHNLKSTGHTNVWTLSILNDCSTITDIPCVV